MLPVGVTALYCSQCGSLVGMQNVTSKDGPYTCYACRGEEIPAPILAEVSVDGPIRWNDLGEVICPPW